MARTLAGNTIVRWRLRNWKNISIFHWMVSAMPYRSAELQSHWNSGGRPWRNLPERTSRWSKTFDLLAATNTQRGSMIDRALNSLTEREQKSYDAFWIRPSKGAPRRNRRSFDVTWERIRQIETKALQRFRHPLRRVLIESFTRYKTTSLFIASHCPWIFGQCIFYPGNSDF